MYLNNMNSFFDTIKRNAAVLGVMALGVLAVGSAVLLSRSANITPSDASAAVPPVYGCSAAYNVVVPTGQPCIGSIDVNLILDRSSSMNVSFNGKSKLRWEKEAMLAFVDEARARVLKDPNLSVRVGVTSYGAQGNIPDGEVLKLGNAFKSSLHTSVFKDLRLDKDYQAAVSSINSVQYNPNGNGTCTECGLRIGRKQLFSSFARNALVKADVLMADGLSNRVWNGTGYLEPTYLDEDPNNPANLKAVAESKLGRALNIDHYVVGYGDRSNINPVTLKAISNTGSAPYYFENPRADQWTASMIKVLDNLCKVSTERYR